MKLKCLSSLLLCGAMSLSILPIEAWSQTSASDNDAIVRFDFNLKRMRENALVANAGADQMLQQVLPPGQADIDIKKIDRVYGGMTAPASMQEAQSAMSNSSDNLPVNFFVRIVFSDKDAATAMLDSLKTNGRVVEANGKTYIAPPANDRDPQNMRAHLADDKTFEIGTTDYITRSDRNVFTKSLVANWEKLSKNDAIRISVDVTGMQGLFNEGMDMARQQVPPQMTGVVEMGSSLAGLSVGMDMNSDTMLTLIAYGKDSEGAENIKDGLNGMLALAKMQAQQSMDMLEEDQQAAAKQVMKALKAQTEGNAVMIKIPKPDGFEEIIDGMLKGGGPGSGF